MQYQSVICIHYPHQLLPALVALKQYREANNQSFDSQPVLVYVRIHRQDAAGMMLVESIMQIVSALSFLHVEISYPRKRFAFIPEYYLPVKLRARTICKQYQKSSIQAIFYAHDLAADFLPQVWMQAFPKASRICFGDSLGIVYSQAYFADLLYQSQNLNLRTRLLSVLKQLRRYWVLPRKVLTADLAILMLPCDPGSDVLTKLPLKIPSKALVNYVLQQLTPMAKQEKAVQVLLDESQPFAILALSNLTEAKLISLQNEAALYQELIKRELPKDTVLIIKPHPGSSLQSLQYFKKELQHPAGILYLSQSQAVYPIELNQALLLKADKILSISYSSVSIPYLYGKAVDHVLQQEQIERYFFDSAKPWVLKGNQEYLSLIEGLKHWDGQTVLAVRAD